MTKTTAQFKKVTTASGRVAYEAWTAVRTLEGGYDVALSAPTLSLLERAWVALGGASFQPAMAQHTYIVKFEDRSDKSL